MTKHGPLWSQVAAGGLGHAICAGLAEMHSNVVVNYVSKEGGVTALVEASHDIFARVKLPPVEQMLMGRMGRPEEIGMVAQMMVANGFLIGQIIRINAEHSDKSPELAVVATLREKREAFEEVRKAH